VLNGEALRCPAATAAKLMGTMMKNTTRKNSTPVKVYCLPEEHEKLKELSAAANLSMSNYLCEKSA